MAKLKEKFSKLDIWMWEGVKWFLIVYIGHTIIKFYHDIFLAYPDGL